jgi:hypothetical protein
MALRRELQDRHRIEHQLDLWSQVLVRLLQVLVQLQQVQVR